MKTSFCTHCPHIFHQFNCCLFILNLFEKIIFINFFPRCVFFFTMSCFMISCCSLQCVVTTTWGWSSSKDVNIHVVVLGLFIDDSIPFFHQRKVSRLLCSSATKTCGKTWFLYLPLPQQKFSKPNQNTNYLAGKIRTKHHPFFERHSSILSTAIKDYMYIPRLSSMMRTVMRDKPSFTLFNLLDWSCLPWI